MTQSAFKEFIRQNSDLIFDLRGYGYSISQIEDLLELMFLENLSQSRDSKIEEILSKISSGN
jgi:hypothetical protein